MQNIVLGDSIEQAHQLVEAVYNEITSKTGMEPFKDNGDLFKGMDKRRTVTNLNKISIMCKRLELEIRESEQNHR